MRISFVGLERLMAVTEDPLPLEGNVYIPSEDFDPAVSFTPTGRTLQCPWKGTASMLAVALDGEPLPLEAWRYDEPSPDCALIAGRVGISRRSIRLLDDDERSIFVAGLPGGGPNPHGSPAFDIVSPDFYVDPYDAYRWMREHAPVYWSERRALYGITRHDDIRRIEADQSTFSSATNMRPLASAESLSNGRPFIHMDDPDHRARRRLLSPNFTLKGVQRYEALIREITKDIIDAVRPSGRCDFVTDLAKRLPARLTAHLMGFPQELEVEFTDFVDLFLQIDVSETSPPGLGERYRAWSEMARAKAQEYLGCVHPTQAPVAFGEWAKLVAGGELDGAPRDLDDIEAEFLLLLIGGIDTTRASVTGGFVALDQHPDQFDLLRREPERIPTAVEEFLRWISPVRNQARTVLREVELHGTRLRVGDQVYLLYGAANRDPAVFEDPETFDITRDPNRHIAFGMGTHSCLGAHLARLELRVFYEELLRWLPDIHIADDFEVRWEPASHIATLSSLPVEFTPSRV